MQKKTVFYNMKDINYRNHLLVYKLGMRTGELYTNVETP